MTLDELFEKLETEVYDDFLVRLKYKYDWEEQYDYSNVMLCADGQGDWYWSWDWNEGQTDVTVIGYVAIEDIPVKRVIKWIADMRGEE